MSSYEGAAAGLSGPSVERHAFLKKVGITTFAALAVSGVLGVVSTRLIAPAIYSVGSMLATVVIFGSFAISHWVARKMVYGSAKMPGLVLAVIGEGLAMGFILLMTVSNFGVAGGMGVIAQCMLLTSAAAGGMLLYVWFSKGTFSWLKAGLSVLSIPMIVLMVLQVVWPIGGVFGLVLCAGFVVVSAGGLLYRLNYVVHELNTDQHIEGAYEITMGILVLFWNLLSLLSRFRR